MMTGQQYKKSLDDNRETYFEGERVRDIANHPLLGECVSRIARGYDQFYSPEPGAVSPLMKIPRSAEELRDRIPLLLESDIVANVTYQSIMTLTTAATRIADALPEYAERIRNYVHSAQRKDVRIVECITDAKGDRSRPPGKQDDPDAYTRVVERRADGVVIRGAKLHITGASMAHDLMVIPTKAMKPGEEAYAIGCAVPVNSPGVKIIDTTFAPRHPDTRTFPVSAKIHMAEGFVILDNVFVPNERIFLDGAVAQAAVFAHSLGLWERLGGLSAMAEEGDQLVGFAQLVAEANGLAGEGHIKEKISEMLIHATLIRAALEAAIANCQITEQGAFPDELYTNAGKYHGAANYNLMVRHLHDISGGSILTAPGVADLENEVTGPLVRKYMGTSNGIDGDYRARLFHAIRDLTADAYGGWKAVTNVQAGGGLYAQRIVTRRYYDLKGAKRKALKVAGLSEEIGS
ncbi:MAG TPA: 4-hydroxyphenylacetate 3-hydroxylase N-terminal domain-containing protein [Candidatus Binatus sp.]|uniref:4-hydroxyphenylacetate 3-hydroxylase N-terminal domain-containing protein n=1 Tax=Candidatus Binatus sp. TaxID=2811406 RepID=UPI002F426CF9